MGSTNHCINRCTDQTRTTELAHVKTALYLWQKLKEITLCVCMCMFYLVLFTDLLPDWHLFFSTQLHLILCLSPPPFLVTIHFVRHLLCLERQADIGCCADRERGCDAWILLIHSLFLCYGCSDPQAMRKSPVWTSGTFMMRGFSLKVSHCRKRP